MRKGQTYDLEDAHQDLCQEEEIVENRKCLVNLCAPTAPRGQLVDLDLLSSFATKEPTAAERIGGSVSSLI